MSQDGITLWVNADIRQVEVCREFTSRNAAFEVDALTHVQLSNLCFNARQILASADHEQMRIGQAIEHHGECIQEHLEGMIDQAHTAHIEHHLVVVGKPDAAADRLHLPAKRLGVVCIRWKLTDPMRKPKNPVTGDS